MLERFKCGGKDESTKKVILTGVLCLTWWTVALGKTLLVKYISTQFNKPLTLSFAQLVSLSIYSVPLLYFSKLKFNCINKFYFLRFLIPLSILRAVTTASGNLALWNISVSYSQIMRGSTPVFTALFCYLILRKRLSLRSYLTLIPIVTGVIITTVTESDFSLFGMLFGFAATSGASLQTIFNKMWLDRTQIHSFQMTALMGWASTAFFFFVWFSVDGLDLIKNGNTFDFTAPGAWKVPCLLILDGFINFLQNVVAFAVLVLLSPTSYAVGNITKRPIIIAVSIAVFKNTVTTLNILGIVVTVIGASLYTYCQLRDRKPKPSEDIEEDREGSRGNLQGTEESTSSSSSSSGSSSGLIPNVKTE